MSTKKMRSPGPRHGCDGSRTKRRHLKIAIGDGCNSHHRRKQFRKYPATPSMLASLLSCHASRATRLERKGPRISCRNSDKNNIVRQEADAIHAHSHTTTHHTITPSQARKHAETRARAKRQEHHERKVCSLQQNGCSESCSKMGQYIKCMRRRGEAASGLHGCTQQTEIRQT